MEKSPEGNKTTESEEEKIKLEPFRGPEQSSSSVRQFIDQGVAYSTAQAIKRIKADIVRKIKEKMPQSETKEIPDKAIQTPEEVAAGVRRANKEIDVDNFRHELKRKLD